MIRNYGLEWERDVALKNGGLIGRDKTGLQVDFGDQIGLYVLRKGEKSVYVGKAGTDGTNGTIVGRLYSHYLNPEKTRKWDNFSWFGIYDVNRRSRDLIYDPVIRGKATALIGDIEALLIYLLDPELNRWSGKHRHMTQFMQVHQACT